VFRWTFPFWRSPAPAGGPHRDRTCCYPVRGSERSGRLEVDRSGVVVSWARRRRSDRGCARTSHNADGCLGQRRSGHQVGVGQAASPTLTRRPPSARHRMRRPAEGSTNGRPHSMSPRGASALGRPNWTSGCEPGFASQHLSSPESAGSGCATAAANASRPAAPYWPSHIG
jgi:hypothetical protein